MINNYLKILLLFLFVFIGCEDLKGPQPSGTLNITISIPGYVYLDDWWDYASKYEIYIDNKLKVKPHSIIMKLQILILRLDFKRCHV